MLLETLTKKFGIAAIVLALVASSSWAQNVHTTNGTEAVIQKTVDGVDLCFLPVETIIGAQVHIVAESYPLLSDRSIYNGLKATTLVVSNTAEPVVIILRTGNITGDWVWKFDIEPGANVVGVHLISTDLPRIEGIPPNIPITGRYSIEGRSNACVYPPVTDAALIGFGSKNLRSRETAFRKWDGAFGLHALDNNLFDYAGISVVSYQFPTGGWEDAAVEVSGGTSQEFAATKARGQFLLDEAVPPTLPFVDEMADALRVPEGLQRGEVWPWVISQGYAMAVPGELLNYLCQIDRLMEMAVGVIIPNAGCRWGGHSGAQEVNGVVLLGPIAMSLETCRTARQPTPLFARLGMVVTVDDSDCAINTFDINKKTFH